jgi:hypothetical protein
MLLRCQAGHRAFEGPKRYVCTTEGFAAEAALQAALQAPGKSCQYQFPRMFKLQD